MENLLLVLNGKSYVFDSVDAKNDFYMNNTGTFMECFSTKEKAWEFMGFLDKRSYRIKDYGKFDTNDIAYPFWVEFVTI